MTVYKDNVIPCDMHTHTGFSDDCDVPMSEMIEGAIERNVKTLAITDHYDPGYPDPEFPFVLDFSSYLPAVTEAKEKYRDRIEILPGMEIGILKGNFEEASRAVDQYPFDFIVGSFHCMRHDDLYRYDFASSDRHFEIRDFYEYIYECLREYTNYDILGHMSIIDRYIGEICDYGHVEDVIDEILKLAIRKDKGLEINTSSFKYGTGIWLPRESILKRYLELGGEILTFGSDSHETKYYQYHFRDAVEFAEHIGFRQYTIFRKRKPYFYDLP